MEQFTENAKKFIQSKKEFHVYSEVVENKLILPRKQLYTMRDYKHLIKMGFGKTEARFICLCSAIYHNTQYSKQVEAI